MRPNQEFIRLFRPANAVDANIAPGGPMFLFTSASGDSATDRMTMMSGRTPSTNFIYPGLQNSLPYTARLGASSYGMTGSYDISFFCVMRGTASMIYTYQENGPLNSYDIGQLKVYNGKITCGWKYLGGTTTVTCGSSSTNPWPSTNPGNDWFIIHGTASMGYVGATGSFTPSLLVKVNGVTQSTVSSEVFSNQGFSNVSYLTTNYLNRLDEAEMVFYKGHLTSASMSEVETYLKNRWGITY